VVLDTACIVISEAAGDQRDPAVAFDGEDFMVVWTDRRSGTSDIYGARVTPTGTVFDEGPVVRQDGDQAYPALARGAGGQMFQLCQGWAGTVGGKTYNTDRIWGKMNPSTGVEEGETLRYAQGDRMAGATIVRGVLRTGDRRQDTGYRIQDTGYRGELLDISGRKVMELRPGANDVRRLAPGVYFVREEGSRVQGFKGGEGGRRLVVSEEAADGVADR